MKKNEKSGVPPVVVVLLVLAAVLIGRSLGMKSSKTEGEKVKITEEKQPTGGSSTGTAPEFTAKKSAKPQLKFFVMSFCPFGNQAEDGLEPVYQLLKDKVDWQPRYIVSEITQQSKDSCEQQACPNRVFNETAQKRCEDAIKQGQVKDMETCKGYFPYKTAAECIQKECAVLKIGEFESLHGVQELNQNVREICAFSQGSEEKWWKFVALVNKNCSSTNADTCWVAYAKQAGYDTGKITSCFNGQLKSLLRKEIEEANKYQAQGSPAVFINEVAYNGGRAPEDYKKAVCASFDKPPKECETVLGQESGAVSGGCAN